MRKELIYCDICNREKTEFPKDWLCNMEELELKFKHFSNIQCNITLNDCCGSCAKTIYETINKCISDRKQTAETEKLLYK